MRTMTEGGRVVVVVVVHCAVGMGGRLRLRRRCLQASRLRLLRVGESRRHTQGLWDAEWRG